MSVHNIPEPKVTKVIHKFTIELCEVEGYASPIIMVSNPDAIPTPKVVEMCSIAAQLLSQFPKAMN